jgi:hypothetical protein
MKNNGTKIMLLIIGLLLIIVIFLLVYYNTNKTTGTGEGKEPTVTEQPAEQPGTTTPTKPADVDTTEPHINEADSLQATEQPEEPEIDSLAMEGSEEEAANNTAETPDAAFLHIPRTKSIFNAEFDSPEALPFSKNYYQSSRGKVESLVLSNNEGEKIEYLITYDKDGNKLDNLEIGLINKDNKRIKYAVVYQNKVSTYTLSFNKDNKAQETVTEYSITNDLRFRKGKTYVKVL